jgi:hypothetical protein
MSLWTKSPRFYGLVAVALGLIGEVTLLGAVRLAFGSWTSWLASVSPVLGWDVLAWTAPCVAVALAVVIGPRLPQVAIGVCIMAAVFYAYTSLVASVFFDGVVGLAEVPALFATCLVAAAISRDRVPGAVGLDESGVEHMDGAVLIGRVMGGTAFAVAGVLTLFAVYALSMGIATLNVYGVLYSLAYVTLCMPAVPLLLLGRRVWRKSLRPSD